MTQSARDDRPPAKSLGWSRLVYLPLEAAGVLAETLVSARGLAALFLVVSAVLSGSAWLRSPLGSDVIGVAIPPASESTEPAGLSEIPGRPDWNRLEGALAIILVIGMVVVLFRPQCFGIVAGVLLCVTIGGHALATVSRPHMIETFDLELEQRAYLQKFGIYAEENPLSVNPGWVPEAFEVDGRVSAAPLRDGEWGRIWRGWLYARYGLWLASWCAVGVLCGTRGPLPRRLGFLILWGFLGTGLGCALCLPRLQAEYDWMQAKLLESQGHPGDARRALERAVDRFPEFDQLQRTWLLAGKLDFEQGRSTPKETFFRAYQYDSSKLFGWLNQAGYFSEWIANPPLPPPNSAPLGTAAAYSFVKDFKDRDRANSLMDDVLLSNSHGPAVACQAARVTANRAFEYFGLHLAGTERFIDGGSLEPRDEGVRLLTAAEEMWRRSLALEPMRVDCSLFLGIASAKVNLHNPLEAEAILITLAARLNEPFVRSDALSAAGDAYFQSGQLAHVRRFYESGLTVFHLPKFVNFHPQRGLEGL